MAIAQAVSLVWRHNGRDSVSNHQPHDCYINRILRPRSKKTSQLRVTGLCAGNSLGTGEFPAQKASNVENVFIWWRHHVTSVILQLSKHFPRTNVYITSIWYQMYEFPEEFHCVHTCLHVKPSFFQLSSPFLLYYRMCFYWIFYRHILFFITNKTVSWVLNVMV